MKLIALAAVAILALAAPSQATIIGVGDFASPTIIDFEGLGGGEIGATYPGVTFSGLQGGNFYDTGTGNGISGTGTNFDNGFGNPLATFASAVTRAGFYITTNDGDDTTVYAYLGATLIGSHFFDTFGSGVTGSFVGIEFLGGFDSLVIDVTSNVNGALAIDDFRYEGSAVPEPGTLLFLGAGLAALSLRRFRR
jgi:hypothetical protein